MVEYVLTLGTGFFHHSLASRHNLTTRKFVDTVNTKTGVTMQPQHATVTLMDILGILALGSFLAYVFVGACSFL